MIALIVPCYNEENRLQLQDFVQHEDLGVEFFFVDDGSKDRTAEMIAAFAEKYPFVHLVKMEKNGGKAEAVRQGFLHAQKTLPLTDQDWVGFWDADLATPLNEIPKMIQYAALYGDVDSIWCSRIYRLGSVVKRSHLRHYLGRGFATLASIMLKIDSYDSQCGAKLFRPKTISTGFADSFVGHWVFDIEILLRLKNYNIIEYPVTAWSDVPGSKLKVYKEIFRVFFELVEIRKKYIKSGT
ncbi:MAG: glycosyltransferase [Bdellovibrio sp.]|nr:glycosyltransferase [Bdellovibrio sp.]